MFIVNDILRSWGSKPGKETQVVRSGPVTWAACNFPTAVPVRDVPRHAQPDRITGETAGKISITRRASGSFYLQTHLHLSLLTLSANPRIPMSPADTTPLLENGHGVNSYVRRLSHMERIFSLFGVPEDQPGWIKSFRFLFSSWLNAMLLFVPLSFLSHHLDWDAALRFTFSFTAVIPLVKVT